MVLPKYEWLEFLLNSEDMKTALKNMKSGESVDAAYYIGNNYLAVTVKTPYRVVNLRRWYKDGLELLKPGREGITLRESEMTQLCNLKDLINMSI